MPITEADRAALALAALGEVTDPADVGELLAVEEVEPGVVDVRFACRLAAYADWRWTVSTSDLPDVEPTVLEVELLPGDGSLLAPPWVPWAERLAEWRKQHPDERHPDEPEDDEAEDVDPEDDDPEDADPDDVDDAPDEDDDEDDVDEDDLAVDDELDELDEAELEGAASPDRFGSDDDDDGSDDDGSDDDEADDEDDLDDGRGPRPADEDRSL